MVKLGKFSGDVLQTQIEETIEEALRASQAETLRSQTASNDVFDVHEVSNSPQSSSVSDAGNADSEESLQSKAENPLVPVTEGAAKIASPQTISAPTYNLTEFLAADTKIVIKKLVELSVGAAFGEIALENANSKRTATIVAETDCKLLSITRADYRNVLADIFAKKKANDIAFLQEVPIFSKLNPKTLETLQSVMSHQTYQADQGDAIHTEQFNKL
jgi:CRP-like cAMP-binding protein